MRKVLAILATTGLLLAACAEDDPTNGGAPGPAGATGATAETGATGATGEATAASGAESNADAFETPGALTVGTGNPAFPPIPVETAIGLWRVTTVVRQV